MAVAMAMAKRGKTWPNSWPWPWPHVGVGGGLVPPGQKCNVRRGAGPPAD